MTIGMILNEQNDTNNLTLKFKNSDNGDDTLAFPYNI